MNDYVLIGILALLLADYVQIVEEWKTRGLTDTSYKVCVLLIGGPACMAYGFYTTSLPILAYVFAGVGLCGLVMLTLKLRDLAHTRLRTLG